MIENTKRRETHLILKVTFVKERRGELIEGIGKEYRVRTLVV